MHGVAGISMSGFKSLQIEEIISRGSIKDSDVLAFRKIFYEDGITTAEEAEILFKLNNACKVAGPSWAEFFVEAITDFIVFQAQPQGYVTGDNAHGCLSRRLGQCGRRNREGNDTEEINQSGHILRKTWKLIHTTVLELIQSDFPYSAATKPRY